MKVRRTFRYNISSTKVFIIHGLSIVILHFMRLLINGCLLSTSRILAKGFISASMQLSLSFKAALSFSSKAFSLSLFSLAFCYLLVSSLVMLSFLQIVPHQPFCFLWILHPPPHCHPFSLFSFPFFFFCSVCLGFFNFYMTTFLFITSSLSPAS